MCIATLAEKLIELQQASKRLLDAGDVDGWLNSLSPEFAVAEQLRIQLLNSPLVVTNDPAVRQILSGLDLTEIENEDKVGSELLFSWISPAEYVARLAQVSLLITPFQVPLGLKIFLEEARQCYALGQYSAVQSLSRTILETAVTDIAIRIHELPADVLTRDMSREYPIWRRFELVGKTNCRQIYGHYKDLCQVVHGRDTSATSGPLGALTKTIGFIQFLYEEHQVSILKNETDTAVSRLASRSPANR